MRKKVRGSNVNYTNKHTHVKQKKKKGKEKIYIYTRIKTIHSSNI